MFRADNGYESLLDVCVNSAMASCRNMTAEQLSELLHNDTAIDDIIHSLPQVKNLPSEREMGLSENKALAEWNLAQQPRLEKLKEKMKTTYATASKLQDDVAVLKSKLDVDGGSRSLDIVNNLLMVAAQEADDDAEGVAREFYDSNKSVDLFLKEFLEKKKVAHLRKIKSERLNSILRDQQYSQPYGFGQSAPYPDIPKHRMF